MNLQELKKAEESPVFKLKPLSKDAVGSALVRAEHYRLLNQPGVAESICLDILSAEAENQKAKIILLLSLTDQFSQKQSKSRLAEDIANSLSDRYSRLYYLGIIHERQGNTALNSSNPGSDFDAYEWYLEAMDFYEQADEINPSGNEDVVLRWNTCARIIMENQLKRRPKDSYPAFE
jgi:replication-associated recombination protein RarA